MLFLQSYLLIIKRNLGIAQQLKPSWPSHGFSTHCAKKHFANCSSSSRISCCIPRFPFIVSASDTKTCLEQVSEALRRNLHEHCSCYLWWQHKILQSASIHNSDP